MLLQLLTVCILVYRHQKARSTYKTTVSQHALVLTREVGLTHAKSAFIVARAIVRAALPRSLDETHQTEVVAANEVVLDMYVSLPAEKEVVGALWRLQATVRAVQHCYRMLVHTHHSVQRLHLFVRGPRNTLVQRVIDAPDDMFDVAEVTGRMQVAKVHDELGSSVAAEVEQPKLQLIGSCDAG